MGMALKSIQHTAESEYQRIEVIETVPFGKTLVLDGRTQSALQDEFVYHECLVHPPMMAVGWASGDADRKPKRVYIGGGGELATAREVLKHPSVEEVVMVDLDKMVVDVSRERLQEWSSGCVADPRLQIFYSDAHAWLNRDDDITGLFDVIILDIADPVEAGPGIALYTQEFYQLAKSKLTTGGVFVTQSGPGGLLTHRECFTSVHRTLSSVFDHVLPYIAEVPSFGTPWGWNLAFDTVTDLRRFITEKFLRLVDGQAN